MVILCVYYYDYSTLILFRFVRLIYAVQFARAYKKIIAVQENNRTKGLIPTAQYRGEGSCGCTYSVTELVNEWNRLLHTKIMYLYESTPE